MNWPAFSNPWTLAALAAVGLPILIHFLTGHASTTPDDLREDNVRHLSVCVSKALQALLISDTEISVQCSAAFFVSRALAPSARGRWL